MLSLTSEFRQHIATELEELGRMALIALKDRINSPDERVSLKAIEDVIDRIIATKGNNNKGSNGALTLNINVGKIKAGLEKMRNIGEVAVGE